MQYPYPLPAQYVASALQSSITGKNLPGFQGLAVEGAALLALFAAALSEADKATLDQVIAGYVYAAPVLPFDPSALDLAVHTDSTLTDEQLGAFLADPRGALLQPAMGVAAATGDWTRVQRLYDSLKASPPSPCTSTTIQAIGGHAVGARAKLTA